MDDLATLNLGGARASVPVRATADTPKTHVVPPSIVELADKMFADYTTGAAWSKDIFSDFGGSQILQAVTLFTQRINFQRSEEKQSLLDPLELEAVVGKQSVSLSLPLQHLCRWAVLVRVGVRMLRRDLAGLVTMAVLPPHGPVKLNHTADIVGGTHYAITHLLHDRVLCRGYRLEFNDDGEWILGGAEGNRWMKDVWLTPGLLSVSSLVESKHRRALTFNGHTPADVAKRERVREHYKAKVEAERREAGLATTKFQKAHGARLDLENRSIMQIILSSLRALVAQVLVYKEEQQLDIIANHQGLMRSELIDDPSAAGKYAELFSQHLQRREEKFSHFRQCGSFVFPHGYMVFSAAAIHKSIPAEVRTELSGVSGVAVGAAYLSTRVDVAALRHSPAALPEVEDLAPLIDACGEGLLFGKVVKDLNVVTRDDEGNVAEEGADYMQFQVEGTNATEELPLDEFLRKTSMRFLPMVVDFHRRQLVDDDLQGSCNGVKFALSPSDVNRRFQTCQPKKSR